MSALARSIYALPYQAKNALDDEVRQLAASLSDMTGSLVSSSISGPIRIGLAGLTGANAGLNQASLSGLSYSAVVRATGSRYGVSLECYASLGVSNVALVVAYAPYTGAISGPETGLSYLQLNPTASASCSNSPDFIPIIGELLNGFFERRITSTVPAMINGFGTAALRSVIPSGPQYLGLYTTIPPGRYVINGVDVGAYLQNNFASYFTGRSLTLTLGPENIVRSVVGVGEPIPGPYIGNAISVDFSDTNTRLSFSIKDVRYFSWRYVCKPKPGAQSCIEP